MIASYTLISALTLAGLASAVVIPLTPAAIDVGQTLNVQWTPDTTGTWTSMNIVLKSGSNLDMNTVTTIATGVDGTTTAGSLDWVVPDVTPYSAIYFIEFNLDGDDPTWTTRFAIDSATGDSTAPDHTTQPNGSKVAWGVGSLAADAVSASGSIAQSSGITSSSTSGSVSSAVVISASTSTSSSSSSAMSSTSGSSSISPTSMSTISGSSSANSLVFNNGATMSASASDVSAANTMQKSVALISSLGVIGLLASLI